jgi:3-oxoadipate enol-lactonase
MKETLLFVRGGCPIHYWLVGKPDRPLITFIHGAGLDHRVFAPQLAVLAPFFRCLLLDLPGQGQSQPAVTPFSVPGAAQDLVALLDHLGIAQTILVGVSLGGTIAQEVALCFPERVKALVVVGIPCSTLSMTSLARLLLHLFMQLFRLTPIGILRWFFAFCSSASKDGRRYVYEAFLRTREQDHRDIWEAFYQSYRQAGARESSQAAHRLLVIRGQHEIFWSRWLLDGWAKARPGILYAVIPDAGHLVNWDQARSFNDILVNFLTSISSDWDKGVASPRTLRPRVA